MPDDVSPNGHRPGPKTDTVQYADIREAKWLRNRGEPWGEIAGLCGYPSANAARMAVDYYERQCALEVSIDERRESLREAVEAYDGLIKAWYDKALTDLQALAGVMKPLTQRDRIKGLDKTKEDTGTGSVLVIGGDEESYLAGLQQVIDDPN